MIFNYLEISNILRFMYLSKTLALFKWVTFMYRGSWNALYIMQANRREATKNEQAVKWYS